MLVFELESGSPAINSGNASPPDTVARDQPTAIKLLLLKSLSPKVHSIVRGHRDAIGVSRPGIESATQKRTPGRMRSPRGSSDLLLPPTRPKCGGVKSPVGTLAIPIALLCSLVRSVRDCRQKQRATASRYRGTRKLGCGETEYFSGFSAASLNWID
jgi:hypothetical protein